MSAVERLQAAIDKLEQLKAESTQGEWWFESLPETGESRIASDVYGFAFMAATTVTFYPVPGGMKPNDAELIVALHRTIDAQIAALRAGWVWFDDFEREAPTYGDGRAVSASRLFKVSPEGRAIMQLADAILGADE